MSQYGWYRIFSWSINASPSSPICQSGNCLYSLEDVVFGPSGFGGYIFGGTLKVSVISNNIINSKFYNLNALLAKTSSQESLGQRTQLLDGTIRFGKDIATCFGCPPEFECKIVNGTLLIDFPYASAPMLTLQAIRQ